MPSPPVVGVIEEREGGVVSKERWDVIEREMGIHDLVKRDQAN